jgi:hypothetical protein
LRHPTAWLLVITLTLVTNRAALAQPADQSVELIVRAGRYVRVALDQRVTVHAVGQPVTGIVTEPVYAYDRVVVPAGTRVRGHIARLEGPGRIARLRALTSGDFTPRRRVVLEFDTLVFGDAREVAMRTSVGNGVEQVALRVAAGTEQNGVVARAREEIAARTSGMIAVINAPGKKERLKEALIDRLPYHPQYLRKGTVYTAQLVDPLEFGTAAAITRAEAGTVPAPQSILNARLVTGLDSGTTTRGAPVHAVLTSPVFSEDQQLILPEGASLDGEVTVAKRAASFHRNGQLRFLFERVTAPEQAAHDIPASLYSVAAGEADHVTIDDEGGAAVKDSKTRFVAPALAVLALRATVDREHHGFDHDADDTGMAATGTTVRSGNFGSRAVGGFFGLGLMGIGLSQISHPVGVALAIVGAARTTYTNVLGRGQEVSFPPDTSIQVQLAPGPSPAK